MSTETETEHEQEQKARLRGLLYAFLVMLALAVVATLTAVVYLLVVDSERVKQNDEIQQFIKDQAVENGALSERIIDCTESTGNCFKEGQARTARAVTGINEGTFRVIVAALSCQEDGITDEKPLANCTAERASEVTVP